MKLNDMRLLTREGLAQLLIDEKLNSSNPAARTIRHTLTSSHLFGP